MKTKMVVARAVTAAIAICGCLTTILIAAVQSVCTLPVHTFVNKNVPAAPAPCSNAQSAALTAVSGSHWRAYLTGAKNVKPGTTGILAPMPGPPRGTLHLIVDEAGQKASWTLTLCDFPQYIASHFHTGSPIADYPPPLIPSEPYGKPSNPFAPPELLPRLCPAITIRGCAYSKMGSFTSADISPLPGREPQGDLEVPTVDTWFDFLDALRAGKIYYNVHSLLMPAGLIRGNLETAGTMGQQAARG